MDKKIIIIITIILILIFSATAFLIFNKSSDNSNPQKTCELECDKYHYSTCPEGCIKQCIGSCPVCEDCDGPGSCACP